MARFKGQAPSAKIRRELGAWKAHLERLELSDRRGFIAWLSESFDAEEFALIVDAEIDRASLWRAYLGERYGLTD